MFNGFAPRFEPILLLTSCSFYSTMLLLTILQSRWRELNTRLSSNPKPQVCTERTGTELRTTFSHSLESWKPDSWKWSAQGFWHTCSLLVMLEKLLLRRTPTIDSFQVEKLSKVFTHLLLYLNFIETH